MTAAALAKLLLVPLAVWLASLAARKWGHSVSGYLGGFPLIGGPITLFLAIDLGAEFAARSALVTLAVVAGQAAHLVTFSRAGRAWGPVAGLLSGWTAFVLAAAAIAMLPPVPALALALAAGGLAIAWKVLPRAAGTVALPVIPAVELWLRLGAALALAAVILFGASALGPLVSGILLSMPITGSIMPPFTLALYGEDALARLLRGFVTGLTGFSSFFAVVAVALVPLGIVAAFALATLAALIAVTLASRLAARSRQS
jgi:hypothetical protein